MGFLHTGQGLWTAYSLATYSGVTAQVYEVLAGYSKVFVYDARADSWASVPLSATVVPTALLAVTYRPSDHGLYVLGTRTDPSTGATLIELYRYGLGGVNPTVTVRASWTATGATTTYSLTILPDEHLLLFAGLAAWPYVAGFVFDPTTSPLQATSESWFYASLQPLTPAFADSTTASFFSNNPQVGAVPVGSPWSWWYPAYQEDLYWIF